MIDARGYSCPTPVLMAKKAIKDSPNGVEMIVDNFAAKENVTRFGISGGYVVEVKEQGNDFYIRLSKGK
ncbi:MAG: sulfurtransferase TusA family protein [Clostridia bacterium]